MNKNPIKYLEWDSDFFEKKIYRCDLEPGSDNKQIYNVLQDFKGDLLYLFSQNELKMELNKNFFLADKKITFYKDVNPEIKFVNNEAVTSINNVSDSIYELVYLSGTYSRFKVDEKLKHKFKELYSHWIEKSISRELASEVFLYTDGDKEIGFTTIKKNDKIASIGLIAVNANFHGNNIGSILLNAAEEWCFKNNVNEIEVATQLDNIRACNFYKKNKFQIKKVDYIYHYYNADSAFKTIH